MRTNKIGALVSALSLILIAQSAFGMNYVNKGVEKVKENWKPVAGVVAVVGIGYGLWKMYNYKQEQPKVKKNTLAEDLSNRIAQLPLTQNSNGRYSLRDDVSKHKDDSLVEYLVLTACFDNPTDTLRFIKYGILDKCDSSYPRAKRILKYRYPYENQCYKYGDAYKKTLREYAKGTPSEDVINTLYEEMEKYENK